MLGNERLVFEYDETMQKLIFGWILSVNGLERTVLYRKKGKIYRLASVKEDYTPRYSSTN